MSKLEKVNLSPCGREFKNKGSMKTHIRFCDQCKELTKTVADKEIEENPIEEKPELSPIDQAKLNLYKWIRALNGRTSGTQGELKRMTEWYNTISGKNIPWNNCPGCVKRTFKWAKQLYDSEGAEFLKNNE